MFMLIAKMMDNKLYGTYFFCSDYKVGRLYRPQMSNRFNFPDNTPQYIAQKYLTGSLGIIYDILIDAVKENKHVSKFVLSHDEFLSG